MWFHTHGCLVNGRNRRAHTLLESAHWLLSGIRKAHKLDGNLSGIALSTEFGEKEENKDAIGNSFII